jgi:ATP-dependent DNA helicase RecG
MRGSIISLIGRVIAAIADDLPKSFSIADRSGKRTETPAVPIRVIREAVVNALMHRSYQVFHPVQVLRYPNRIVIKNPGYSLKSQDRFDDPGSYIRNPTIAEILHESLFAETKGSGIKVMQQQMALNGLTPPAFKSDRDADTFTATLLFHHFLDEKDINWLSQFADLELTEDQMKALIFIREVGAIDNAAYRSLTQTDTLAASKILRELRVLELLSDQGSGARTYYVPGLQFIKRGNIDGKPLISLETMDGARHNMDGDSRPRKLRVGDLPLPLRMSVKRAQLSRRLPPLEVEKIIERLCDWRPMSLAELAYLMERTPTYISQKFVTPMVANGRLRYFHPEMVQHPDQKYQSPRLADGSQGKR